MKCCEYGSFTLKPNRFVMHRKMDRFCIKLVCLPKPVKVIANNKYASLQCKPSEYLKSFIIFYSTASGSVAKVLKLQTHREGVHYLTSTQKRQAWAEVTERVKRHVSISQVVNYAAKKFLNQIWLGRPFGRRRCLAEYGMPKESK